MSPEQELELHRVRLELMRVSTAKAEMSFQIMQRKAEIARLESNIKIQVDKEIELSVKLAEMEPVSKGN